MGGTLSSRQLKGENYRYYIKHDSIKCLSLIAVEASVCSDVLAPGTNGHGIGQRSAEEANWPIWNRSLGPSGHLAMPKVSLPFPWNPGNWLVEVLVASLKKSTL